MEPTVFWSAVQGIGTVLAAVAAIIALVIAGRQLGELISSNKLLAASNEAMTESNLALTRPYIVVDFEFAASATRSGDSIGTSVLVVIRNDGRTPAHNIRLKSDHPFTAISVPEGLGWTQSIEDLNRLTDGVTVLKSLTNTRPLKYYLDGTELFGEGNEPGPTWDVVASYEDGDGHIYSDTFRLEVEPWRRSIVQADPLLVVGKHVESVAHEVGALARIVSAKKTEIRIDPARPGRQHLL